MVNASAKILRKSPGADSSLGLSFVCPCEFPNDLCISLPLRVDHKAGGSRLTASTICRATQILRSSKHRMKNESTDEARFDAALAHGLARVALGLNIAIHGYSRLPNLADLQTEWRSSLLRRFSRDRSSRSQGLASQSVRRSSGHSCFLGYSVGLFSCLVHC